MLSDIVIPQLIGHRCDSTGMDSRLHCLDRLYYDNFLLPISYQYNQRGFRDREWPPSLDNTIVCIGDSFTVGLGLPFDLIWPSQLQRLVSVPVINISMDGASNQWILRMAESIFAQTQPKVCICMWSYAHRRELDSDDLTSMERRLHFVTDSDMTDDYNVFSDAVHRLQQQKVIHLVIPNFHPLQDAPKIWQQIRDDTWPESLPNTLDDYRAEIIDLHRLGEDFFNRIKLYWKFQSMKQKFQFIDYDQIDWARDMHHLGVESSRLVAYKIAKLISVP